MRGRFRNRSFCIEHTLLRHSPLRVFLFLPNQNHHNQNWIPRRHCLRQPTHRDFLGKHHPRLSSHLHRYRNLGRRHRRHYHLQY